MADARSAVGPIAGPAGGDNRYTIRWRGLVPDRVVKNKNNVASKRHKREAAAAAHTKQHVSLRFCAQTQTASSRTLPQPLHAHTWFTPAPAHLSVCAHHTRDSVSLSCTRTVNHGACSCPACLARGFLPCAHIHSSCHTAHAHTSIEITAPLSLSLVKKSRAAPR